MSYYNITGLGNFTNPSQFGANLNILLFGGWLGAIIVFLVFGVLLLVFRGRGADNLDAVTGASVSAMVIAWIIQPLGWSNEYVFSIATALGLLCLIALFIRSKTGGTV